MDEQQKEAARLIAEGLRLAKASGLDVVCSVDISCSEGDAENRCFGVFEEVNSMPSDEGFGSSEIQLLFSGNLNT